MCSVSNIIDFSEFDWAQTQLIRFPADFCVQCVSKNVLTLKRYTSKLQGAILMKFGRNIQNTLE